jgi:hypothetical protein
MKTCICKYMIAFVVAAPLAIAQDAPPAPAAVNPYPPLYESGRANSSSSTDALSPDTRPLTGVEQWTLGSSESARNLLVPTVRVSETADTNPSSAGAVINHTESMSSVSGGVTLQRDWSGRQFSLGYFGGGVFNSGSSQLNSSFHSLSLSQTFNFRRWSLLLSDSLGYSNQIGYGDLAKGGNLAGYSNFSNLNTDLAPAQSINTERIPRLSNTSVGQISYNLSSHSSFNASASYGVLSFFGSGLFDSNQLTLTAGYNNDLTPHNTVGGSYSHNQVAYDVNGYSLHMQAVQLHYGRRITGRIALQLAGGPQIVNLTQIGIELRQTSWTASSSLLAQIGRNDFRIGYSHGATGGSGVLLGAATDGLQVSASRVLRRQWTASTQLLYAHNRGLQPGALTYDFLDGRVGLEHEFGRHAHVTWFYNVQRQTTDGTVCAASTCDSVRHVFGMSVDWKFRPIPL